MRLIVASLALLACGLAAAQSYPNRPVKIVAPFSAGSGSDVYTRLIADDFRAAFNQTFLVENKGGASAQIGSLYVAKSDIRDKLMGLDAEIALSSPLEMGRFVKQQLGSWGTKIRNAGILPE